MSDCYPNDRRRAITYLPLSLLRLEKCLLLIISKTTSYPKIKATGILKSDRLSELLDCAGKANAKHTSKRLHILKSCLPHNSLSLTSWILCGRRGLWLRNFVGITHRRARGTLKFMRNFHKAASEQRVESDRSHI